MDRLQSMEAFVRVAERGSFAAAATDLGLTPSALSKLVTRIEDRLGVRLLTRTTRKLALTAEGELSAEDMQDVLSAGVSPQQVRDALAVCAAFNITDRLADAFGFQVLSPEGFEAGAKYLLKRGYR